MKSVLGARMTSVPSLADYHQEDRRKVNLQSVSIVACVGACGFSVSLSDYAQPC